MKAILLALFTPAQVTEGFQSFSKVTFMQRLCLCTILFCSFCVFCLLEEKAKDAETAKKSSRSPQATMITSQYAQLKATFE